MTTTSRVRRLHDAGVSVWLDDLSRPLLDGALERYIREHGLSGVTSNPTIFATALRSTDAYDVPIDELLADGVTDPAALFFALALHDVGEAARMLRPTYERSGGRDGYVSFECTPDVAADTEATIEQASRVWERVGVPNLMIKVPATDAGVPAIEELTAAGINVNVTLLFSVARHDQVARAYLRGLARRVERGEPVDHVRSVASVFVSRIDARLETTSVAIANARVIHRRAVALFDGPDWEPLAAAGSHWQRPLWASTAPKDPAMDDVAYVEALALPDTIVTVPAKTLAAYADHGTGELADPDDGEGQSVLDTLDIDLEAVGADLEDAGLRAFADAYGEVLASLAQRRQAA